MNRRNFLIQTGIFSASIMTAIGSHTLIARTATPKTNPKRLIVIFLRGAVDGLSVVVPYTEQAYYEARPKIAIPQPGKEGGLLNLDGRFGLHPALAPLTPIWQQKSLAFVHACGSPDATRSHFDAQDYMESGTPGIKRTADGWMNRLLAIISERSPIQAVSVGATTPRILSGKLPVANIASGRGAASRLPLNKPRINSAFGQLYDGKDKLSQTYKQGIEASLALMKDLDAEMKMANNGAPNPYGFPKDAQKLGQLMAKDPRIEIGFVALGGWDTHINQGNSKGQLARNLESLGKGLVTLVDSLGSVYQDTTILVMSEFGRTVRENGNAGTDHGHGNVMWVLGGKVLGGKVYGQFPGLDSKQLYQERDLAITTDFRDVIAGVLEKHLYLDDKKLNQVLPGYTPQNNIRLI
jgi:uncharacterized protein (DUF1501 family)